jgi:hypothetical protein
MYSFYIKTLFFHIALSHIVQKRQRRCFYCLRYGNEHGGNKNPTMQVTLGGKNMDPIFGWLAVVVGFILIYLAIKNKLSIGHPVLTYVLAFALIVLPFYYGVVSVPTFGDDPATVAPGPSIPSSSWVVTASAGGLNSNETYNAVTRLFTVPVYIDTNSLDYTQAALNFSIRPVPYAGQTSQDLAVLYYEITNYNAKFEGEYILAESNDERWANWTNNQGVNEKYSAQSSMLVTGTAWANLTLTFDSGASTWAAEVTSNDLYGPIATFTVRFYDNFGWTQTYTVNLIVTGVE